MEDEREGTEVVALRAEIDQLREKLEQQKVQTREMWRGKCEQLVDMDNLLYEKAEENSRLRS